MILHKAFYEFRSDAIRKLKQTKQPTPYPHKFHVSQSIPRFVREWGIEGRVANGATIEDVKPVRRPFIVMQNETESDQVTLAGRVMTIRESSSKLRFYDLKADGQKVQVLAQIQLALF